MKTMVFSSKKYDRQFLDAANAGHEFEYVEARLNAATAVAARGYDAICVFVNDRLCAETLRVLAEGGTRFVALRCAGFNNVDLEAAARCGISVARVPAYSPNAVAEHVIALLMSLYRSTHRAYNRVREGNFSLDGLVGHEVSGKTVGIIGTGRIGVVAARILKGMGCRALAYDVAENPEAIGFGVEYVDLEAIWKESDIISLHCPLNRDTKHLINAETISRMKDGVTIINTSRGGLVDTRAVYAALKTRKIGHLGIDVYEEEEKLFFEDLSTEIIQDDLFMRLMTFPNVLVTSHQAFFTNKALTNIAQTTVANLAEFERTGSCRNAVA